MSIEASYLALGLMSGTSLDGVDLALCRFELQYKRWGFKIIAATTIPYPAHLSESLEECMNYSEPQLMRLDKILGKYYAEIIMKFLSEQEETPDIIASHGHTVFHRPDEGITLQIGDGKNIHSKTGITVINDFRSQDVLYGGQGAPLVPIGDRDLFFDFEPCVNLGGFANISYTDTGDHLRKACDVSPCNMALNYLSKKLGQPYDSNGLLARGGDIDTDLLKALNSLEYYSRKVPKSLGKEWLGQHFLPILDTSEISIFDKLATVTEHIAMQLGEFIRSHEMPDKQMMITGGGTYNEFLLERVSTHCEMKPFIPADNIINYKEAVIFAYLGVLRDRGEINVLSSVTGAEQDSSSGIIYKL